MTPSDGGGMREEGRWKEGRRTEGGEVRGREDKIRRRQG